MARKATLRIRMKGQARRVAVPDALRFVMLIGNKEHVFGVHEAPDKPGHLTVTHWDSGMRVTFLTPDERAAFGHADTVLMGMAAVEKTITQYGVARVASVLFSHTKDK